jgi:hypothetical protein
MEGLIMSVLPADPVRDHSKRLFKWALAVALMAAILCLSTVAIRVMGGFMNTLSNLLGSLLV